MQLKITITAYTILFTCLMYSVRSKSWPRKECWDCEEELWEEVLCDSIPENTSPRSTISTTPPMPTKPTTEEPSPTTTLSPVTSCSATADPYQKCYCECKGGCKEYCRESIVSPLEKEIVQEPAASEDIDSTQSLQRKLIADATKRSNRDSDIYAPSHTDDARSQSYSLPIADEHVVKPETFRMPYYEKTNIPSKSQFAPLSAPAYGKNAVAEVIVNKHAHHLNAYLVRSQQPTYFSPLHSNAGYKLTIPFENAYAKVRRPVLDPVKGLQSSLDGSMRKIPRITYFASGGILHENDVAFDSFVRNAIKSDSNPAPYHSFPYIN